jgi:hypothetical protein
MTRTETELELARQRVAELETKVTQEAAAKEAISPRVLSLAISLHQTMCPYAHPDECSWGDHSGDNDPTLADWTDANHSLWLQRAQVGVQNLKDLGFEVHDPS